MKLMSELGMWGSLAFDCELNRERLLMFIDSRVSLIWLARASVGMSQHIESTVPKSHVRSKLVSWGRRMFLL